MPPWVLGLIKSSFLNEVLSQLVHYGQPTTSLVITQLPLGEAHRSALPYGLAHPSRPGVNGAVAD